jgi:para-aminobenzoate synthetase component 1
MNQWGEASRPFVFLVDFECRQPKIWELANSFEEILLDFPGFELRNYTKANKALNLQKTPVTLQDYTAGFEIVKKNLEAGNSFLTNFTSITRLQMDWSMEEVFASAVSKYKVWYKGHFVCFSPETFVRIKDGQIKSYPMKGTIDADLPNARELILGNDKEMAEHATIVDLIRNDLSMVSSNVEVTQYRKYEVIPTGGKRLGQVSSEITGKLECDYKTKLGEIIFSLLPAGSISGAPKKKTVEIIREAEGEERGYYTGICGYFDGESLDSCVLIRYLDEQGRYRSGGGITFLSNLEEEYQEMIDKVYVPIH